MNPKRKKILIVVLLIFAIGLILGSWLIFKDSSSGPYDPGASREPEAGGPKIVALNNSEKLAKLLLPAQFDVAKQEINDFIYMYIDKNSTKATIVGEPQQSENGIITFTVRVEGASTSSFTVNIDRWTYYDKLIFSVPDRSYTTTLQVYSN